MKTTKIIPAHLIELYAERRRREGDEDAWKLYECAMFGHWQRTEVIRGRPGWCRDTARHQIQREMREAPRRGSILGPICVCCYVQPCVCEGV